MSKGIVKRGSTQQTPFRRGGTLSTPSFSLTNKVEVEVLRPSKVENVHGRPVQSPPTRHTIEANIQPLKFRELVLLPEAERNKEWIVGFCDINQDIRGAQEGDNGWDADVVVWNGFEYRVMKIRKWQMGILNHIQFHAARKPISTGV